MWSVNCAWLQLEEPQNKHSCVRDESGLRAAGLFVLLNYNKGHTLHQRQHEGEELEMQDEFTSVSQLSLLGDFIEVTPLSYRRVVCNVVDLKRLFFTTERDRSVFNRCCDCETFK